MNLHRNARTTVHSRAEMARRVLEGGQTPKAVAAAFGVDAKTVRKWVARFAAEGRQAWRTARRGRIDCAGRHPGDDRA